jgi:hypothetical protein
MQFQAVAWDVPSHPLPPPTPPAPPTLTSTPPYRTRHPVMMMPAFELRVVPRAL